MSKSITQAFIPGPRLIDGSDLNSLVVQINAALALDGVEIIQIPIPSLAALANGQTLKTVVPYAFQVQSVGFRVGQAVTTGSKAATLTGQVSGVAMTGGVVSLTSANATPAGALVAGTAVTGTNTGAAGGTVEVAISAVTTFVEGSGWVEIQVINTGVQ